MFEKESEEYTKKNFCGCCPLTWKNQCKNFVNCGYHDSWKDGAEFGYNKANEWHYMKDGDLPEDDKVVLFYTTYFDFWIGGIEPKNDKKHRWEVLPSVSGDYYAEDEVIAWKEIVLPKEIE